MSISYVVLSSQPIETAEMGAPALRQGGQHYLFLDGMRGATATYVMMYHLLAWVPSVLPLWVTRLQRPLSFGHVAVSIFIVLSGFSLGLPVARSSDRRLRGGAVGYLRRRARRILPAYFAATVLGVLITLCVRRTHNSLATPVDLTAGSLATHLLLIHNLWPVYAHTINMAHWSVAAEWQIYFIFPLLLLPAWRIGGELGMILCGLVLAAIPLIILPAKYNLSWTCPWYIALFAIGAAASRFELWQLTRTMRDAMVVLTAVLGMIYIAVHHLFYVAAVERPFVDFSKDSLAGLIVAVVLVYCVASFNGSFGRPLVVRILESRVLRWLGSLSYSLYLIHCSVLVVCLSIAGRLGFSAMGSFWLRAFIGIPVSIIAAKVLYVGFERPFLNRRAHSRESELAESATASPPAEKVAG